MKFWWPQTEAIIATLYAYLATSDAKYLEMHKAISDWTYKHLPMLNMVNGMAISTATALWPSRQGQYIQRSLPHTPHDDQERNAHRRHHGQPVSL